MSLLACLSAGDIKSIIWTLFFACLLLRLMW